MTGLLSCLSCLRPAEEPEVTELDFAHCSLNDVPNNVFDHERTLEQVHSGPKLHAVLPACRNIQAGILKKS